MVYQLIGNEKYRNIAEKAKEWLLSKAYYKQEGRFYRGISDNGTEDTQLATDTHSWGVLALIDDMSIEDLEKLVVFVENNAAVKDREGNIIGFDFTYSRGIISYEWTMHMALVYKVLGNKYKQLSIKGKAEDYYKKADILLNYTDEIVERGRGLPYVSEEEDTIHGWRAYGYNSIAAESWYEFAKSGFNPFKLIKQREVVRKKREETKENKKNHKPVKTTEIRPNIKITGDISKFLNEQRKISNWPKILSLYRDENFVAAIIDDASLEIKKNFNSYDSLLNFIENFVEEVRFYEPSLDTKTFKGNEIPLAEGIKYYEEEDKQYVLEIIWEEDGRKTSGIFLAGQKLIKEKYEIAVSYKIHREIEHVLLEILRSSSRRQQDYLFNRYGLTDIVIEDRESLILCFEVKTNERGHYTEIVKGYTQNDIYVEDGKLKIAGKEVKYYTYDEKGKLKEISQEESAKAEFVIFKTSDGNTIVFGENVLQNELLKAIINQIIADVQKINAENYVKRLKRTKYVEAGIAAINIIRWYIRGTCYTNNYR